jgi:SAM-dependent methyltransferase
MRTTSGSSGYRDAFIPRTAAVLYETKLAEEVSAFAAPDAIRPEAPIFEYYTKKYVSPALRQLGSRDCQAFFLDNVLARAHRSSTVRVVSYGAGNCELEIGIAAEVQKSGCSNVHFTCVDLNPHALERARHRVIEAGLDPCFSFVEGDLARLAPKLGQFDIHIAFQFLHHLEALELVFSSIARSMDDSSIFLVSDMIGRNGHMRWPETLVVVQRLWSLLQPRHRINRVLAREDTDFVDHDCSTIGFEGIRAQDIMPLLAREFDFEEFVGFGGIVEVFAGDFYGPNFEMGNPEDIAFIDYAQRIEANLLAAGAIKPTQMIAKLRRKDCAPRAIDVSRFIRNDDPPQLPNVDDLHWKFSDVEVVARHTICGDDPWLGSGFHDFDSHSHARWTQRSFSLKFGLPEPGVPSVCHLRITVYVLPGDSDVGCDVFVNRSKVTRFEDVFGESVPEHKGFIASFVTLGGAQEVTFLLDRTMPAPNGDQRELGVVLTSFTICLARGSNECRVAACEGGRERASRSPLVTTLAASVARRTRGARDPYAAASLRPSL